MILGSVFGSGDNSIVFIDRIKKSRKFMGAYPAWFRAFVFMVFAYTICKHGFEITPNVEAVISWLTNIASSSFKEPLVDLKSLLF